MYKFLSNFQNTTHLFWITSMLNAEYFFTYLYDIGIIIKILFSGLEVLRTENHF